MLVYAGKILAVTIMIIWVVMHGPIYRQYLKLTMFDLLQPATLQIVQLILFCHR